MSLSGIRILDLTRLLPGAFCTMLLADMGADVVKIEEPGTGDYMRWTPPLIGGQSALFNALNRNKRSVTLNLKTGEGRDLLLKLAEGAAVGRSVARIKVPRFESGPSPGRDRRPVADGRNRMDDRPQARADQPTCDQDPTR